MNDHGLAFATEPSEERAVDEPSSRSPSWMLLRLALETRELHPQADADRLAVMDVTTAIEYRRFVVRAFGFEAALEDALVAVGDLAPSVLHACAKANHARADLRVLGMTDADIDALPRCPLRFSRSATIALGWLFVNERLTLLSGLIRRHLSRALPTEMAEASAYLRAYGETTGLRFRLLGDTLADHARKSPAIPAAMVGAAREAFAVQRQWFSATRRRVTTDSRARAR